MEDGAEQAQSLRRVVVTCRVLAIVGIISLSVASTALLAVAFSSGFARPAWLALAVFVGYAVAAVTSAVFKLLTGRLNAVGLTPFRHPKYLPQRTRPWLIVAWALALIAGLTACAIGLSVWIPAEVLGSHPGHAVALTVRQGPECYRCSRPVTVTFGADGYLVEADLAGADGLQRGDGPGLALVYDRDKLTRVMRQSDWSSARDGTAALVMLSGVSALTMLFAGTALLVARRRRRYGLLRPGEEIATVEHLARSGGATWRVRFADHSHTEYLDSPRSRAALIARLGPSRVEALDRITRTLLTAQPSDGIPGGHVDIMGRMTT